MFAHRCTYVSSTCAHTCDFIAHAVYLDTYLCSSGAHMRFPRVHTCALVARDVEHMCVPHVHTCVSELDTRFIAFQANTHVRST